MTIMLRRRGIDAKKKSTLTTYNFPSGLFATPTAANDDAGIGLTLGFEMMVKVAGLTATGIRWWSTVAGISVAPYLWDNGGTTPPLRASGSAVVTAAGWNFLPFTTPYALVSGADYLVGGYQASSQKYTAIAHSVASSTQFGISASKGAYNYGTGAFLNPDVAGGSDNWFGVDIVATQ